MERYITTGEFAQLCGTTKHTLIHYDQMGVLTPAQVGANGYRYYAPAQIEVFHVIETLRELDMPLSDIRAYLDRRSPEEFAALMERETALLGQKIARLKQMRQLTRQKAQLTRQAMAETPGVITLEREAEQWLVCTPALPMTSDWNISAPLAQHMRFLEEHGIVSPYSVGSMGTQEGARAGDPAGYTHYYTRVERKPRGVEVYIRPAGTYLTCCHADGYNDLPAAYRRLLDHAAAHGLRPHGPFFEDVLLDELSVEGYDNYVLRLSVRVEGASEARESGTL